jgi:hypothetical protein
MSRPQQAAKEKPMSTNTIDSANAGSNPERAAAKPKRKRKTKKAKPAKKAGRVKKAAGKPKVDRANKKAEVIAMMKRAKGAMLPEIIKATGWQPHTVRGFNNKRRKNGNGLLARLGNEKQCSRSCFSATQQRCMKPRNLPDPQKEQHTRSESLNFWNGVALDGPE